MDAADRSSWTGPDLQEIEQARDFLADHLIVTPTVPLTSERIRSRLPERATVTAKLELFQQAGSFKARGALLSIQALTAEERRRGIVTASAGNHALAVSWAAKHAGVAATVVMPKSADPSRVEECKHLGASVVFAEDIMSVFARMDQLVEEDGLVPVHPYEGRRMTLGAATCGLELIRQAPDLDVVVVPIGGGGLIGGIASGVQQISPACQVIGVEPMGADLLCKSLAADQPVSLEKVSTIADSLGAPVSLPISFGIVKARVDKVVRVTDDQLLQSMALLYDALKLAPEPACAASLAAVCGPLRDEMVGKRVGIVACGSNIAESRMANFVSQGRALLASNPVV
ncbi:MAG: pyridoxal-phosphate dependent enzyme [Pseudomonadota bacterium]